MISSEIAEISRGGRDLETHQSGLRARISSRFFRKSRSDAAMFGTDPQTLEIARRDWKDMEREAAFPIGSILVAASVFPRWRANTK